MSENRRDNSATVQLIAHQESEIARMNPDDPALPETRRLLDALRQKPVVRRVLDLRQKSPKSE